MKISRFTSTFFSNITLKACIFEVMDFYETNICRLVSMMRRVLHLNCESLHPLKLPELIFAIDGFRTSKDGGRSHAMD